jgi:hypothetical protein
MRKEPERKHLPPPLTEEQRKLLAYWSPETLAELDRERKEWEEWQREKEREEWHQSAMKALTEAGIRARAREAEEARQRFESMKPASEKIQ